uniref:Cytoplasmic tRNA 2-thiolation protein 2 n=1 Tax=Ignisphaera aggregans TaxID=334771 RepID=A0A7C2ZLU5_9CREN
MSAEHRLGRACSACKRREAIYRRKSSGEQLCKLCLFHSLVKQVRKAIHYYKMVVRSGSTLFIIRPDAVGESVVGFNIFRRATRDFQLSYNILCIDGLVDCSMARNLIGIPYDNFIVAEATFKTTRTSELLKYIESVSVKAARKINAQFVVTPLFRDEMAILSLLGILTTSRSIFSEGLPVKLVDSIKIVRPFFYVISSDVAVLAALDDMIVEPKVVLECDSFMKKAKNIFLNSVELMYSSIKSVELFQSYVFGSSSRCKYCGAFSLSDVCDVCKNIAKFVDAFEIW